MNLMTFMFTKRNTAFFFNVWCISSKVKDMAYNSKRMNNPGKKDTGMCEGGGDTSKFVRQPSKPAGNGLMESTYEYVAAVRIYVMEYARMLAECGDVLGLDVVHRYGWWLKV